MADQPLVSVVIPTFNRADYVAPAIESALAQTWPQKEVIVVDDGSTDDTKKCLEQFGGAIRYFHQENRGVQAARNRGVAMAAGSYVALLDSDDLWLSGKLARDLEFLEAEPGVGMACARMEVIDADGRRTGALKPRVSPGENLQEVIARGSALFSSFSIRRSVLDRIGGFDESIRRFMDLDFTLSVLEEHRIKVFAEPLVLYRDHESNLSKDLWGIPVGRFHLTKKWSRRLEDRELRRACLKHVRDCSRALTVGYLKQGKLLRSLRYGGEYLRTRLALLISRAAP